MMTDMRPFGWIMLGRGKAAITLEDWTPNVKIVLAALWAAQFLLWTFGDAVHLLQGDTEPISNDQLLFVAVPLALIQASMILFSLVGKPVAVRWANMGLGVLFIVFNLGFIADSHTGWEYLLGIGYVLFSALIIWYAWKWPKQK